MYQGVGKRLGKKCLHIEVSRDRIFEVKCTCLTYSVGPLMEKTSFNHMVYGEKFFFTNAMSSLWFIIIGCKYAH